MITAKEYLKGRDLMFPKEWTPELQQAMEEFLNVLNEFIADIFPFSIKVTSGWRPTAINNSVGGASKSKHCTCNAVDIHDPTNSLWKIVLENLDKAKELGLYFEDKNWTPSWIHIQNVPPKSGKRIFIPNSNPPQGNFWNGKYDSKYD